MPIEGLSRLNSGRYEWQQRVRGGRKDERVEMRRNSTTDWLNRIRRDRMVGRLLCHYPPDVPARLYRSLLCAI